MPQYSDPYIHVLNFLLKGLDGVLDFDHRGRIGHRVSRLVHPGRDILEPLCDLSELLLEVSLLIGLHVIGVLDMPLFLSLILVLDALKIDIENDKSHTF